jgi:hypothetical protein
VGCGSSSNGARDAAGGSDGAATDRPRDMAAGGSDGATMTDALNDGADAGPPIINFTFATSDDMVRIDTFQTTSPFNIGANTPDGGVAPTATFDPGVGLPTPGSLDISATFTDFNQVLSVRRAYASTTTVDLTGKTLTAKVRLDSPMTDAGVSALTGRIYLFILTTPVAAVDGGPTFLFAQGPSIDFSNLRGGATQTLTFDIAHPVNPPAAGFDASKVVQVGVQLGTPNPTVTEAGTTPFGAAQAVVLHLDTVVSN